MNPLLSRDFKIPFREILPGHLESGVREAVAEARGKADQLGGPDQELTWQATVGALDGLSTGVERAVTIASHLNAVVNTDETRAAWQAALPVFSTFFAELVSDQKIWGVLKAYNETAEAKALDPVRRRRLDHLLREFRRGGADLDEAGRKRVQEVKLELSEAQNSFNENVLASTRAWELLITDESRLAGLPAAAREAASESARASGREGWLFTLHQPSVVPVLQYADDRELRREVHQAYNSRAASGEHANQENMVRILRLRAELAGLLGFDNFADYRLETNMVGNGQRAVNFGQELFERTLPYWQKEIASLEEFARTELGLPELEAWDVSYASEKLRHKLLDFDAEELRPYFSHPKVMAGLFQLANRLFGITVTETPNDQVWHDDVLYYEVHDHDGTHIASFYADWFPRDGKRAGAWMNKFIVGGPRPDGSFSPHLGIIMGNLTPPVGNAPARFTHREVQTIFHEFGHLLHQCLSRVSEPALAGTSVSWDWVELPSQIMENWTTEREALDLFARHDETGEPIPDELLRKLVSATNFNGAIQQMRQLSFGALDLALHTEYDAERDGDVVSYVNRVRARFVSRPEQANDPFVCAFSHIFAGGYAASYYSYKWSEVLDADAFTRFRTEGIFNPDTGRAFREAILETGDSVDPNELYLRFMGRPPELDALIARNLGPLAED